MDPQDIFDIFTDSNLPINISRIYGSLGSLRSGFVNKKSPTNPQLREIPGPNENTPRGGFEAVDNFVVFVWLEKRISPGEHFGFGESWEVPIFLGWRKFLVGKCGVGFLDFCTWEISGDVCVFFCWGRWADIIWKIIFEQKS